MVEKQSVVAKQTAKTRANNIMVVRNDWNWSKIKNEPKRSGKYNGRSVEQAVKDKYSLKKRDGTGAFRGESDPTEMILARTHIQHEG